MEIKEKQQINKNAKKFKIDIKNSKDIWGNLLSFYREHIIKLHIIFTIITFVIFIVTFVYTFSKIKSGDYIVADSIQAKSLFELIKYNGFLSLVIIIAGITPFFYISAIGIAQGMALVDELALRYAFHSSFYFTSLIGGLIQIVGIGLCIAVGLYYCKLSSKKYKYYHHSSFGMDDIKERFFDIRKDEKKLEKLKMKREEKARKIQEANIKIPYFNIILLGIIGFLIQVVGTLIAVI